MKKFKLPITPKSRSKTIRLPDDLITEIDKAIDGKDCTFTAFIVEAAWMAVIQLKEEPEEFDK